MKKITLSWCCLCIQLYEWFIGSIPITEYHTVKSSNNSLRIITILYIIDEDWFSICYILKLLELLWNLKRFTNCLRLVAYIPLNLKYICKYVMRVSVVERFPHYRDSRTKQINYTSTIYVYIYLLACLLIMHFAYILNILY